MARYSALDDGRETCPICLSHSTAEEVEAGDLPTGDDLTDRWIELDDGSTETLDGYLCRACAAQEGGAR